MKKLIFALAATLIAGPAAAHTGHGDANGLVHGLLHPLTGPDHLMAMLAVGLWSGFVLPDRLWRGAATFMVAMIAGAGLSLAHVPLPGVEPVILASVVVFGLMLAFARRGSHALTAVSLAVVALFASFHGYAHATEATGAIILYLAGFLISTAALHLAGIGVAVAVSRSRAARLVQATAGLGIAAGGLALIAG